MNPGISKSDTSVNTCQVHIGPCFQVTCVLNWSIEGNKRLPENDFQSRVRCADVRVWNKPHQLQQSITTNMTYNMNQSELKARTWPMPSAEKLNGRCDPSVWYEPIRTQSAHVTHAKRGKIERALWSIRVVWNVLSQSRKNSERFLGYYLRKRAWGSVF